MMSTQAKKPEIRFKGFTDDWEQRKLGEIGDTYTGLSGKSKEDFGHGEGKFVTYMNVFSNTISNPRMTEPVEIDGRQNKVQVGDVFFTTSSETPEEVGISSVWLENSDDTYLNSFCFGYRPREEFDNYFLAYMLRSTTTRKKIAFLAQGISRYNISKSKVMEITVPKPKIVEQEQIGRFFTYLDYLIILHQQKYEKLVIIKKAMLEKMFPKEGCDVPELRFGSFIGAWGQRKLRQISDKVNEKNTNLLLKETFTNSAEYGVISQRDFFDHDITNANNIGGYYVVQNNDFVYNPRISAAAPVGPINRNKLGRSGVVSPLYTVFRPHDVDYTFLEQFFKTRDWHSFMYYNGDTGTRFDRFSIKTDLFFDLPIPYPKIEEQRLIGRYLNQLDMRVILQQQKVEKLKKIKSACMEKMFV